MKLNDTVRFAEPMPDEIWADGSFLTFVIIEIREDQNWCMLQANVPNMTIKPTQPAKLSELIIAQ